LFQLFALLGLHCSNHALAHSHLLQGGYKVKDFVYIGTPMQFILWIVTVFILSTTDTIPWWVSWLWSFGVFVLVSLVFVFPSLVKSQMEKAKDATRGKSGL
jgi:hypothetical protein